MSANSIMILEQISIYCVLFKFNICHYHLSAQYNRNTVKWSISSRPVFSMLEEKKKR